MREKEIDGENKIALWRCIIFSSSLEGKNGKHILQYPSMYLANFFPYFGVQWLMHLTVLVLAGTEFIFFQVLLQCCVSWIYYENSVEGTVMFWLLLSSSYLKSRIFQFLVLCQWGGAWGAGRAIARAGDLSWSLGYSIPQNVKHSV